MEYELNNVYCEDNVEGMKKISDNYIDITVTSPPYDKLRDYSGNGWDFTKFTLLAKQLYLKTKPGGVLIWVVGDETIKGGETGSSFRQALFFMKLGFKLFDVLIYEKNGSAFPARRDGNRYSQIFEYMFVFSKDKEPNNINLIKEKIERYETEFLKLENKSFYKKHNMNIPIQSIEDIINTWSVEGNSIFIDDEVENIVDLVKTFKKEKRDSVYFTKEINDLTEKLNRNFYSKNEVDYGVLTDFNEDGTIEKIDMSILFIDPDKTIQEFEKKYNNLENKIKKGNTLIIYSRDKIENNFMSGLSFEIILNLQEKGYIIHDTMILSSISEEENIYKRYNNEITYLFVLSKKIKPNDCNLICDKANRWAGFTSFGQASMRAKDGELKKRTIKPVKDFSPRNNIWRYELEESYKITNIWKYNTGKNYSTKDKVAFEHPAIFPEKLVQDCLLSFSKEGDIVFDPFSGSGTTFKISLILLRKFLGFEIFDKYVEITKKRVETLILDFNKKK